MTDEEIKMLLDSLERMSKIYSYIPEEKQKEIILTQLIADREYQNINVRTVSKWLDLNGKTYHKEVAHIPTKQIKPPLEGPERDAMLELWKRELAKVGNPEALTPTGGGSRLREQFAPLATIPQEESRLNEYLNEQALNEKGIEGTGEATGLPENNPENPQPREDNNIN